MLLHTATIDCLKADCVIQLAYLTVNIHVLLIMEDVDQQLSVQKWPFHHIALKVVNQLK